MPNRGLHEAISRGIFNCWLRFLLPDNLNYNLVFNADQSLDFPDHSVCSFSFEYSAMPEGQTQQQLAAQEPKVVANVMKNWVNGNE